MYIRSLLARRSLALSFAFALSSGCVLKYPLPRNSRFIVDISEMQKATFLHDTWVYRHPSKRVRDYPAFWLSSLHVFPSPVKKISKARRRDYDALEHRLFAQVHEVIARDFKSADRPNPGVLELKIAVIDIKPIVRMERGGTDVIKTTPNAKGMKFELDATDSVSGELIYAVSTLLTGDDYAAFEAPAFSAVIEKEFADWIHFLAESLRKAKAEVETPTAAITLNELKNIAYLGFRDLPSPLVLKNGVWEGEPFSPGSVSRPRVTLVEDLWFTGDLNADHNPEAVVFLSEDVGGTGRLLHMAVVTRQNKVLVNTETLFLGDRVQIRRASLQGWHVVVDLVQPGVDDPTCCPGDAVHREWFYEAGKWQEAVPPIPVRLTPSLLKGSVWTLKEFNVGEPAPHNPPITLQYDGQKIRGNAGCNTYSSVVSAGVGAGDIAVGPLTTTRMACNKPTLAAESKYLKKLEAVRKFGFIMGKLALTYEVDRQQGVLIFTEQPAP